MRPFVQTSYLGLLRLQGGYVLLFLPLALAALPGALDAGLFVTVPAAISVLAWAVAAVLVFPLLTPHWLSHPSRPLHGLANALLLALLPLLFVVPTMGTVIAWSLPEPYSESLAILAAGTGFLTCGLAWWLSLALSLWPATVPPASPPAANAHPA